MKKNQIKFMFSAPQELLDRVKKLDDEILCMLANNGIQYQTAPGDLESINDIVKRILRRLGKEMKIRLKQCGFE